MLTQAQGNGQPSLRPVRSRAMASIVLSGRRGESLKEEGRMAMPATWFFTQKGVLFNGKADHSQSLSPSQGKKEHESSTGELKPVRLGYAIILILIHALIDVPNAFVSLIFPRIPFTRGSKLQHAVRLSPVTSPADMDGGCDVVPSMHEEGDDASMHASERGFFSCFHIADDMMGISI
ncbi:hypothetical protein BHE74_00007299 [Ensete ventricosum]|nr:hypothetical protein BHE74_00007299 [Ensete ventricosum]